MVIDVLLVVVLLTLLVVLWQVRRMQRAARAGWAAALQAQRVFSEAFEVSPIPLALTSLVTHHITAVNRAYERMTGWTRDEITGRTVADLGLYAMSLRVTLARRLQRAGCIRNYPLTITTRAGDQRDVRLALDIVVIDGEPHSLTTILDQTDHNRAVAALQFTDERMRELADTIDEVFWIRSPSGAVLYISPAYEELWGRSVQSAYDDPLSWRDAIVEEDRYVLAGAPGSEYSYRIQRPDATIRWIRTKTFPVCNASGEIIRVAGVCTDITEQRLLEEQLRHAQKMESLGMLAGGIAHDFNNLLAVISSCNGLLAETLDGDTEQRELVDDIGDAVVRAAALTRQLLAFSRKQVNEPVVLDPNLVITDTRKLLRRMLGVNVEVVTSLEPDVRPVRIDRSHLVQVILNLAVNARDAMQACGTLRVSTRNIGDDVLVEVCDTGSGMSPEVRVRACEPFFTTKEQGKGTGMGLAVVHGIVDHAGGRIEIDSTVGVGTTFKIYLPAAAGQIETPRHVAEDAMRGVETVLIVDDDEYVRRTTARALRSRGYTVIEAGNGRAALVALPNHDVDLLLTDMVMPGMSGRVLAGAARARVPDLKTLFMTGYTDDEAVHLGLARGEVDLIEKPFTIRTLAQKVREVLDRETKPTVAAASYAASVDAVARSAEIG